MVEPNPSVPTVPALADFQPSRVVMSGEVLAGLSGTQKTLPCKYFYDARGSRLFDSICELEEYYLTRSELEIMRRHVREMAKALGPECLLIEYGSGSSYKTRSLLDQLEEPSAYVPVDISRAHLARTARRLARAYPACEILPVCADFTQPFALPKPRRPEARRAVFFPGSTLGNFERSAARALLAGMARVVGSGGGLLLGLDLEKDARVLEAAYNDRRGVTAEFNRNLLHRLNRELQTNFRVADFEHRAFYNRGAGRIEMHLVSRRQQVVALGGHVIALRAGESICTEYSHKYALEEIADLAAAAGWRLADRWLDDRQFFSVNYLVADAVSSKTKAL